MIEARSHLQSLQTQLQKKPQSPSVEKKLLSVFGKWESFFSSSLNNKNLSNTYRAKNSVLERAKNQRSSPTHLFVCDENNNSWQSLTWRARVFRLDHTDKSSVGNSQCIHKAANSLKAKEHWGSDFGEWGSNFTERGGFRNFFCTASVIEIAFGPSLESIPHPNSPYVPGDSQNQLIQSCAKEARDTSSQICWLLSRARWWSRC